MESVDFLAGFLRAETVFGNLYQTLPGSFLLQFEHSRTRGSDSGARRAKFQVGSLGTTILEHPCGCPQTIRFRLTPDFCEANLSGRLFVNRSSIVQGSSEFDNILCELAAIIERRHYNIAAKGPDSAFLNRNAKARIAMVENESVDKVTVIGGDVPG